MSATKPKWERHAEGWQLGVVAVGMAFLSAILALPRAVPPRELPLPDIDRLDEHRTETRDRARVEAAATARLPYLVRAAGEAFRRFGRGEAKGWPTHLDALGLDLRKCVADARKHHGDEPLLALRAVQAELFVHAVERYGKDGKDSGDLTELGGAFATRARAYGWISEGRASVIPTDELAVLFAVRWTKLAGLLETYPFAPSLNDWRLYYRTLLLHPEVERTENSSSIEPSLLAQYVRGLSRRDPDYPELLARGILAHWMYDFGSAASLFQAYLVRHPTGAWRLRAQNYLLAARRQVPAKVF